MGLINSKLRSLERCHFEFWCPGCKDTHAVGINWGFDGNYELPTITPSLLVTSGHYVDLHQPGSPCWCTYNAEHPNQNHPFHCQRCHSFIRAGKIMFLSDCTHELAGQTVDIPELPEHLR